MAFPVIESMSANVQTSNSTSWSATYPTGVASGNLLLCLVSSDGSGVATVSGFTSMKTGPLTAVNGNILGKVADGTESGAVTISIDAAEQGAWRFVRISGWYGGTIPSDPGGTTADGDGVSVGRNSATSGANPDPPSLNPANWDVADTLWIAACMADTSRTISVYPLADNNLSNVSGGSTGASLGFCTANDAVASKDPGTFTISASDDWNAFTIAVRPSAAATFSPPPPPKYRGVRPVLLGR